MDLIIGKPSTRRILNFSGIRDRWSIRWCRRRSTRYAQAKISTADEVRGSWVAPADGRAASGTDAAAAAHAAAGRKPVTAGANPAGGLAKAKVCSAY